jgi:hypothetical protein
VFVPVMMMIRRDADPSTNHRVENQIYNCLSSFVSHDDLCHLLDHATAPVAGSSPIRSFRAARPMLSVPRSPARYAELAAPRRRENERQQRRIVITRRVGVERLWHSSAAFFYPRKGRHGHVAIRLPVGSACWLGRASHNNTRPEAAAVSARGRRATMSRTTSAEQSQQIDSDGSGSTAV